jgi:chemotaxis protein histidine kinase CheA
MAHSIKGMAASLDYDAVSSLAHRLEDWMEPLRAGADFDRSQLDLLAEAIAALEEMVACVDEAGTPPAARDDLLARLAQKREDADATRTGLKKKLPRPRRRRSLVRFAFARRRSTASWPR